MARPAPQAAALNAIAERLSRSAGKNHAAQRILSEVNRIAASAQALDNVNVNRSPVETEAAHVKKVAGMARKLDSQTTAAINAAGVTLREGLSEIQRRIDDKVNLKPDEKYAAEIRAAFRGVKDKDRLQLLGELVDNNRGPELAAIVRAPSILTGLSDEMRSRFEQAIVVKHAADDLAEMENLNETFEVLTAAARASANFVRSLTDPAEIARIEREEAAAQAAGNSFEQAVAQQ